MKYKFKRLLVNHLLIPILIKCRVLKYQMLSYCAFTQGKPKRNQPLLMRGKGSIIFGNNVTIGIVASPAFFSTYAYFEARNPESRITIADNVWINNNACLISEGEGISIGPETLIGPNLTVFDTDFHELHPARRIGGTPGTGPVHISGNVFIGADVTILKGVVIGENSIIASGSVVTRSIPGNVIAAGNPCVVIKPISDSHAQ